MKTLYLLHEDLYFGVAARISRFKDACAKANINLVVVDNRTADYVNLARPAKGDMLYKVSDFGYELETHMLNADVTTFYIDNPHIANNISAVDFTLIHNLTDIAQPKTVTHNKTIDRQILKNYVDYVNGFPLIIKTYGLSRGIGVIKIDGWESFISTIDFLVHSNHKFIIREYIKCNEVSRLMVLGNEVIASWYTPTMDDDFRNVADASLSDSFKQKQSFTYDGAVNQLAITAVHQCGIEFGAVDMVFNEKGDAKVLEVNFPCGLTFDPSGENEIVEQMVNYLKTKSESI